MKFNIMQPVIINGRDNGIIMRYNNHCCNYLVKTNINGLRKMVWIKEEDLNDKE